MPWIDSWFCRIFHPCELKWFQYLFDLGFETESINTLRNELKTGVEVLIREECSIMHTHTYTHLLFTISI